MIKSCVLLDGNVINIGPWDYQYKDVNGEQVAQNPLPDGAETADIDIVEGSDGGLYPADYVPPKTPEQMRIEQLETQLAQQNADMTAFMDFYFASIGE